jgi:hypothetical protein
LDRRLRVDDVPASAGSPSADRLGAGIAFRAMN